jgi:hypothetical protein
MAWVLKMFLSAGEAEYFFRRGLDDPNQVEFARQIEVYLWLRLARKVAVA